jgi:hypothetical protein
VYRGLSGGLALIFVPLLTFLVCVWYKLDGLGARSALSDEVFGYWLWVPVFHWLALFSGALSLL